MNPKTDINRTAYRLGTFEVVILIFWRFDNNGNARGQYGQADQDCHHVEHVDKLLIYLLAQNMNPNDASAKVERQASQ